MKVVILAGGLGSRLAEETLLRPKPMVEIGGRPMLWHILNIFGAHGLNDFVIALGYKALLEAERSWRDMKSTLELRPVHHRLEDRIRAHVQLCWLALLLVRVIEVATASTWRNIRDELERMHLVSLATAEGQVAQRSLTTAGQRAILAGLDLPEPPRYFAFTPAAD